MDVLIRLYSTGELKTINKTNGDFVHNFCGDWSMLHAIIENHDSNFIDISNTPKINNIEFKFNIVTDNPITFSLPLSHIRELMRYIVKPNNESDKI
jgi:hypothetical protein